MKVFFATVSVQIFSVWPLSIKIGQLFLLLQKRRTERVWNDRNILELKEEGGDYINDYIASYGSLH